jgi:protein gp37
MAKTSIEWTDATWNPTRGCSKVSAGCANCFAERMAARFSGPGQPYEGLTLDGHWVNGARFVPEMLDAPLRWKQPRRVFVNSMSDLFHDDVTNEQIAAVFGVMAACPQHTFQVLTKRPQRMLEWFEWILAEADLIREDVIDKTGSARPVEHWIACQTIGRAEELIGDGLIIPVEEEDTIPMSWPLPNVHLLVSCEDQATANERIPLILRCPAAVRGVSLEPLLGAIDLTNITAATPTGPEQWDVLSDDEYDDEIGGPGPRLSWVIVGAETGPHRRSCDVRWIKSLVNQCRSAGVACFVKSIEVSEHNRTRVSKDPNECGGWPKGLRVRMYPGDKWP